MADVNQEDSWVTNLEAVQGGGGPDELQELRARAEGLDPPMIPGAEEKPKKEKKKDEKSSESGKKKKKKKKKKEKKAKKEEKSPSEEDGRRPVASGTKGLMEIYAGTGMDPRPKIMKRVLKKAKKYISRKEKKEASSSSGEDSSSTGGSEDCKVSPEGLFLESSQARSISERFPGILAAETLSTMQQSLLLDLGEESESSTYRPVATAYYRQCLSRRATGPVARELLNLTSMLDCLTKGKIAAAADICSQRIKSAEVGLAGTHWAVAQRMEIPVQETSSIAGRLELQRAQREDLQEAKVRKAASNWTPKVEEPRGKGKQKGGAKDDRDRSRYNRDYNKDGKDKGAKGDKKGDVPK